MKAGGIAVVATYAFWIHHEETDGRFDFTGDRDLRGFVEACRDVGLPVIVRLGPWCHGEVRNGGLPDWVVAKCGSAARTLDPLFMEPTTRLYGQLAGQLRGLLWKDGGPVVGVQVDNEYGGPAEYLMELKRIAIEAGLDVPFYTRTGWPSTSTPMPFGEMLPLFGGYAEGFWARELTPMPGLYWKAFAFELVRTDAEVGADMLGTREVVDTGDTPQYPYLTCEIGGGMEQSYHHRVRISPLDVLAVTVCKMGGGSNLPGYYMYHGGTNPPGRLTTLQESQATQYWNDVPTKSYDFQAPLGQYGQVRPHYHLLRRLHLFLESFGELLAEMPPALPAELPQAKDDVAPIRWAVRSDGEAGYLFINNYQRLQPMPARPGVQFEVKLPGRTVTLPDAPIDLPADFCAIWPFSLQIGHVRLDYATAQLVCDVSDGDARYVVFAQIAGVETRFRFTVDGKTHRLDRAKPGLSPVASFPDAAGGTTHILLLSEAMSLRCWKFDLAGQPRLVLSAADLFADGDTLHASPSGSDDDEILILPPPANITVDGRLAMPSTVSGFGAVTVTGNDDPVALTAEPVRPAGPLRTIREGFAKVAEAPNDAEFEAAAVWRIGGADYHADALLRIDYVGDVARLYAGERLVTDQFWIGVPFDLAMDAVTEAEWRAGLTLKILPLQHGSPMLLPPDCWEKLEGKAARADVLRCMLIRRPIRLIEIQ